MIYNVQLLANNPDDWENPRPVEVPDNEVVEHGKSVFGLLERIFYWGQNDFQPRQCCSVSMGDVAEIPNGDTIRYYMCKGAGWEEISAERLEEYKKVPQRDRTFSEFVRD
jgi:hypothetical protein